ncbi:VOC family protein [Saxibacter everestensis]|uniref:VOC family protein n=1 Tax=Saxibacter everestensis TaxID=2909229 RepID=A0ABY8QUW7_9MICO|nr:VOC family protein [Brevibacteriaceae bacterium ZFBP1038]
MPAQLSYWTLAVTDVDRAVEFFGAVMGWTFSEPGSAGGRHVLESDPWGGLAPALPPRDSEEHHLFAVGVDGTVDEEDDRSAPSSSPGTAETATTRRNNGLAFQADDLDAAIAKVRELGGTAQDTGEGGDYGRWVECTDDQGTAFALFARAEA